MLQQVVLGHVFFCPATRGSMRLHHSSFWHVPLRAGTLLETGFTSHEVFRACSFRRVVPCRRAPSLCENNAWYEAVAVPVLGSIHGIGSEAIVLAYNLNEVNNAQKMLWKLTRN